MFETQESHLTYLASKSGRTPLSLYQATDVIDNVLSSIIIVNNIITVYFDSMDNNKENSKTAFLKCFLYEQYTTQPCDKALGFWGE